MFYVKNSMKMKDNTDRLLEAVEHPERFTDEELADMLADAEMRELYDTMRRTSDLLSETQDPDIDGEWSRFASRNGLTGRRNVLHVIPLVFNRHAAAVITAAVISLAVVAATIGISYSLGNQGVAQEEMSGTELKEVTEAKEEATPDTINATPELRCETVIFRNESLERIMSEICSYYGASVTFAGNASKDLHLYFKWDQSLPLTEVVDQLNSFEQININTDGNTLTID